MAKYNVPVVESTEYLVPVEADDEDEAREIAVELIKADRDRIEWLYDSPEPQAGTPDELTRYEPIIHRHGDDYEPFERVLYPDNNSATLGYDPDAAVAYLAQWDYDEYAEGTTWDDPTVHMDSYRSGKYLMTWHTGLCHAHLYRVVEGAAP